MAMSINVAQAAKLSNNKLKGGKRRKRKVTKGKKK